MFYIPWDIAILSHVSMITLYKSIMTGLLPVLAQNFLKLSIFISKVITLNEPKHTSNAEGFALYVLHCEMYRLKSFNHKT